MGMQKQGKKVMKGEMVKKRKKAMNGENLKQKGYKMQKDKKVNKKGNKGAGKNRIKKMQEERKE